MPNHFCQEHNTKFYEHAKDGKVWYSHKQGDKWCNEKLDETPVATPQTTASTPANSTPDWDAIAEGKVRHGVAIAYIEQGRPLDEQSRQEMNRWVEYIMRG